MVVSSVCMCIRDRCDSSTMGVSRSQKLFMTFKYTFVTGELLDIRPFFPFCSLCVFRDQDSNVKVIRELRTEIQRLKAIIASGDLVST